MPTLDIVNAQNDRVGTVDLDEGIFGDGPNLELVWESVVRENAARRRGTHATKNRALVSGSGRKPWRQKGTGRARVGEIRNPLWRKGGTVFGPQPRSYEYRLPRKVELGALRAAFAQKLQDGAVVIVEQFSAADIGDGKTKSAAELVRRWAGESRKTLVVDVAADKEVARAVRNVAGVTLAATNRLTARQVMAARKVIVTKAAFDRLSAALSR